MKDLKLYHFVYACFGGVIYPNVCFFDKYEKQWYRKGFEECYCDSEDQFRTRRYVKFAFFDFESAQNIRTKLPKRDINIFVASIGKTEKIQLIGKRQIIEELLK